ncbi:MAG: vitamin K epoxide reductase family protein [Pseudomonadota bacterium]
MITGASGFLGRELAQRLQQDFRIVRLDLREDELGTLPCDLTDPGSVATALDRVRREYGDALAAVVHLAAYYAFSDEPHPLYRKLNVDGTRNLLLALQERFRVERFVYASTMLVHAPTAPGVPVDESSPINPTWAYPQSKWQAEQAIRAARGHIPVAVLRLAGAYTDDCGSPTLSHQIQRIYEHTPTAHLYAGALDRGQAFLYMDDLILAFEKTIARRAQLPDDFCALIGEPGVMTYRALQNLISRCLGHESWQTYRTPGPLARLGARMNVWLEKVIPDSIDKGAEPFIQPFMIDRANDHFELDIGHARKHLGWEPAHRLRDHVPVMIERLKADPQRFYRANALVSPVWLDELEERADDPAGQLARLRQQHEELHFQNRWSHLANVALGAWLVLDGFAWGGEGSALVVSNAVSGATVVLLAVLSHVHGAASLRWATALVGLWIAFAPLVFLAETPAAYLAGTLLGGLIMIFSVALPPEPGVGVNAALEQRDVPSGWSYNPSTWPQRAGIVALAFVGLLISRYLGAYQLDHTTSAWDPFFGSGTEEIITSRISEAWPVPDAALGGFVYLLEIVTGITGGRARWRTMPWLVLTFGILIVPLGAVSIYFIIIQPVLLGTWCTLCMAAAVAMTAQIPLTLDELGATLQFLDERRRAGRPLLWVLFRGDDAGGRAALPPLRKPSPRGRGLSLPWTLLASILIGCVLIGVRLVAGDTPLANANHVIGALVFTVAAASLSELGRPLRLVNVILAVALLGAPFLFTDVSLAVAALDLLAGVSLLGLALPRGRIRNRYGPWERYLV